jgi:hypothetical protein
VCVRVCKCVDMRNVTFIQKEKKKKNFRVKNKKVHTIFKSKTFSLSFFLSFSLFPIKTRRSTPLASRRRRTRLYSS